MSKYHKCPKCGYPAQAYIEAESLVDKAVGKLRKFYCHNCKFTFWREPGGLG